MTEDLNFRMDRESRRENALPHVEIRVRDQLYIRRSIKNVGV